ncbi:TetR/AcrR family transcriptional regulator C-terminal domain-containing protein [Breznakiella homolactica]|uniref:TetR/AcrR family transcriptional regulator C-terminal domain-containing protein n=1 Tax=Breznakiella homolactica TaxID=2798577 RepID=A0A7T7XLP8_9SPIR|nr:TetR/AcrR family transcriptional regulator C-terminal domain-containing protein [Breznakiella homolactica]QQO08694.1 TetR/AcrR family transcriptional regulator C-terminal domain-containing protein [Breznakiella homolactica]
MSHSNVTKEMLADAMKKFMTERPFEKITVGDLVQHCRLNRNSFYYHFKDKYELVNWIFYHDFIEKLEKDRPLTGWDLLEKLTYFFYENKSFYAKAITITGYNCFSDYFFEMMQKINVFFVDKCFEETAADGFYTVFCANIFLASITWWLKAGTEVPPEKLMGMMKDSAGQAAFKIVNNLP